MSEHANHKHGASHGGPFQREYRVWKNMRNRCRNPRAVDFGKYGGRGIRVCERWNDFRLFIADMGPAPTTSHTLDRRDVNGDYEPSNCRWATQTEQQRNRTNNKLSPDKAAEIRSLRGSGWSLQRLADRFDVSKKLVLQVVQGKAWA